MVKSIETKYFVDTIPLSSPTAFFSGENVVNPNTFPYYATIHPKRVVETASLSSVAPPDEWYNSIYRTKP